MKSIDFDLVADLYDAYVKTDIDQAFWLARARACSAPALELMCGTGRITLPLLGAGMQVEGLDYSHGLLERFRSKLQAQGLVSELYEADARDFSTGKRYGLIYIGFNSIAEVVDDADKLRVFARVRQHLLPDGEFWLTLHNPPVRAKAFDGLERPLGGNLKLENGDSLEVSGRYTLDAVTKVVIGEQRFVILQEGHEKRRVVQPVSFHLIDPNEIEHLLRVGGFRVTQRLGDFVGSPFDPEVSPFFIVGCRAA
jgi:SAM-dependent methyltransferase